MKNAAVMEFHISRKARDLYQFDESLFTLSGNVIFPNFRAVRLFVQRMNEKRDLVNFPEQAIHPGQMNAMGLIDEILHYITGLYGEEKNSRVMKEAIDSLYETFGEFRVDETLRKFAEEFPAVTVYRQGIPPEVYLEGETEGVANRQILLEEMLMFWMANRNPAFSPFIELFGDATLEKETLYLRIMGQLHLFFNAQPPFGPDHQNLIDMLRSPAIAVPHSLSGQLEYIRERWGFLLGRYLPLLLSSLDLIKEEELAGMRRMALWSRAPAPVYEFTGMEGEPEHFSPDLEWMPRLVLLAKNIYVWIHQLSRKYHRSIYRLDQIPDEELDRLAHWGFTGLWLIGLWERSLASKRIKELLGSPDAVASAYSLFDYQIAGDLGGEEAFQNLKDRAWRRGIRLASDMVPNHMGIDSRWVIEHPDWFVSSGESPFPAYRFSGPDLSWHEEVGIHLEDHYFDQSDAAVVFKRVDHRTGGEQYIYHGNDGTRMPWNDTAQLNFLKEEIREAVIQNILHVARNFTVIRFDAAMTLTKKHFQRLWFPEPGTGGAIPSRAEHGMTREEFHRHMPEEFWRQVVDRVAREAPGTLLLAEAFWLLEGYFVRTLGMHRVYNSAFMNMLKDEENAKYRSVMKNTLEFNPEILKRFVNFMSNPDEETAVAQFGKEDKYFGVCTLIVTLPGLPMFAHGQIEGFTEKYGMEYRYAKWDEQPDQGLVQRHEREIFPLMKRRSLFSGVDHFLLYDFFTLEGQVNENVFAYSNRFGEQRSLVIYHNRYEDARGWVRTSVAYSGSAGGGGDRKLIQKDLGEGLGLHNNPDYFCIFRDHVAGLEYLRNSQELCDQGLYVELGAYKYHVFLDFREIQDNPWHHYARIANSLNGSGVPSIEEAFKEMLLQPLQDAFKELVRTELFHRLMDARITQPQAQLDPKLMEEITREIVALLREAKYLSQGREDEVVIARELRNKLEAILYLPIIASHFQRLQPGRIKGAAEYLHHRLTDSNYIWGTLFSWLFVHALGQVVHPEDFAEKSRLWIDDWRLDKTILDVLKELGLDEATTRRAVALVKLLTSRQRWFETTSSDTPQAYAITESLFKDREVAEFLRVNQYHDLWWFHKESFEEMLWWLMIVAALEIGSDPLRPVNAVVKELQGCYSMIQTWQQAEEQSDYQVEKLLELLKK
ncbi:MAG: alpha-amylase [Deltaproteobacteria bacterium RBG_16_49_23]|nr:MAG: alpha-amylase [Deltaproteobacteria bacterium RBG_16_49_23]